MKIKINGLYEKILLSIVATLSNSNDISSPNAPDYLLCTDIESGITFATKKTGTAQLFDDRYLFGNDADNASELVGSYGNDHFCGMGGNDTLNGHDGNDYLEGGSGDDVITGGKDKDTLVGGAGVDTFQYVAGDGNDRIVVDGVDSTALTFRYPRVA